jgi:hypothetical protein
LGAMLHSRVGFASQAKPGGSLSRGWEEHVVTEVDPVAKRLVFSSPAVFTEPFLAPHDWWPHLLGKRASGQDSSPEDSRH